MDENGIKTDQAVTTFARGKFVGTEDELTSRIIGVFYSVFNELGFGFVESVYKEAMAISLREAGLAVSTEAPIPVSYHGQLIGSFRADVVVERRIILELKTAEQISKAYEAQLLHYLRASVMEVGLILNFGQTPKFRRMEFRNDRKHQLATSAFIPS